VVLETDKRHGDETVRLIEVDVGVDDDIADEPSLAGLSADINEADAREALGLCGLVVVAEELIAAAHC
jgi:hypothetical protein